MRKVGMMIVAVLALTAAACTCTIEKRTVNRLEESLSKQHTKFLRYVEADPNLIDAQKQVERDNVASQKNLLAELKKAVD